MIGPVCFAVDRQRARAADAFATIGIECDRFLPAHGESLVDDIEHFEKRSIGRNVGGFVVNELALGLRVLLSPNAQFKVHNEKKLSRNSVSPGSARASRANFGALAEISPVERLRLARAPIAAREGACAPRSPACTLPVIYSSSALDE